MEDAETAGGGRWDSREAASAPCMVVWRAAGGGTEQTGAFDFSFQPATPVLFLRLLLDEALVQRHPSSLIGAMSALERAHEVLLLASDLEVRPSSLSAFTASQADLSSHRARQEMCHFLGYH
jgi:hypothetical protein